MKQCSVCGEVIERELELPDFEGKGNKEIITVPCMCACRRREKAEREQQEKYQNDMTRVSELKKLSLMDAKLKDVMRDSFSITDENKAVYDIATRYLDNFQTMYENNQGLLFYGNVGTGKSYTAAMIANELLKQMHPVIMTSFVKLLQVLGNGDNGDYIERLNRADLLIIDDLGAERGTEYALENVYNVIDSRYRSGKPIILTTNMEISHMKNCDDVRYNRIYDRIFEMCYPVKFTGLSWRKKEAAARFQRTRALLEG